MSFFEELKRRNVIRMGLLYAVVSWFILQVVDVLFENLAVPGWAFRMVLVLLAVGFPFALIFAWIYELTPEGIKRESDIDRARSTTRETGRKINVVIVVLLVLAVGGLIADRMIPERAGDSPSAEAAPAAADEAKGVPGAGSFDERSIAVLPFVNLSGDPENEYFSDGLSEELLNTLAGVRELKVTGRTSSFAFKGQNIDLREVGEKLGVANVLEGSVRKAGNQVRITAQLVKTDDGYHLWSEAYDRELDDIFAIQKEIAEHVTRVLQVTLLGAPDPAPAEQRNTAAYEAYLRGRHLMNTNPDDADTLQRARRYFEEALETEPDYTAAWFGMFEYWNRRNRNGLGAMSESQQAMERVAKRLSEIDPDSVEALLARARSAQVSLALDRALELLRQARDRYPGSPQTHMSYAAVLSNLGRFDEARAAYDESLSLDPLSLSALINLIYLEVYTGDCDAVRATTERATELQPDIGRARGYVGYCLLVTGADPGEAESWLQQESLGWLRESGLAIAYHRLGQTDRAETILADMMERYEDTASFQYAEVYAQWGQVRDALTWLDRAREVRDPGMLQACVDRFLDPIRGMPEFAEILQRAGLGTCPTLPPLADH